MQDDGSSEENYPILAGGRQRLEEGATIRAVGVRDVPTGVGGAGDCQFKAFRQFNAPELRALAGLRARIDQRMLRHFPGDGLPDRIARRLAEGRVLKVKEVFESFEFFERVRRRLRAAEIGDLCAGHGLTGLLFAVFEPRVSRVVLLDRSRPENAQRTLEAVAAVAPWVRTKVEYVEARLADARTVLSPGAAILGIHACGVRTDRILELAIVLHSRVAVMPCCYAQTATHAPRALHEALGIALATDIHRTYRLEAAGYHVEWAAVPSVITPKNRVIIGLPRQRDEAARDGVPSRASDPSPPQ